MMDAAVVVALCAYIAILAFRLRLVRTGEPHSSWIVPWSWASFAALTAGLVIVLSQWSAFTPLSVALILVAMALNISCIVSIRRVER